MTDREPDDLYDALRDRLADFGQEPPAQLWAGIRAQLPPPVAQPQLRRRRRWAPVALLLLLLTIGSGAGWFWWQGRHPSGSKTDASLATSASSQMHTEVDGTPASSPTTGTGAGLNTASSKAKQPNTATTTTPQNRSKVADLSQPATAPAPASWAAVTEKTVTQDAAVSSAARHSSRVPGVGTRRIALSAAASARPTKQTRVNGLWAAAGNESGSNKLRQAFARNSGRNRSHNAEREPAQANTIAAQFSSAAAKRSRKLTENLQAGASPSAPTSNSASSAIVAAQVESGQNQPNGVAASSTTASGNALESTTSKGAGEINILSRLVALQLATWPQPAAPQPVVVELLPLPVPVLARWSVQATAGPAFTYRYLQGAPATGNATGGPYVSAVPGASYPVASPNTVAELERPALGGGAQVSVRRTLSEHWSLSAGLGYAEYATRLALQQVHSTYTVKAGSAGPDSSNATSLHRRDAYRFATVPVRAGYTWAPAGRWRVGVLAGADAAIYLGGSSTEGSSCACQTQTWGLTGSPYRRVSLGASLGAEVRYRLTGRWELLAQPTATYLLTPLARQATAFYPRHLFGGTALLGVSFDLP
ncbi:outer membrane beta-barrel protein [Hymenobacter sp. BT770]|uniref:outer membrane beta-barrel protein n=1 Tax=Hymenobacter sp. BT770 TaxID=2886942 RepID=UPI001D118707|nr:outer membrane beta-barrel protein [Hymenobacter sp. BT770]MCC3154661.1 PorT family protein [Hymenobacter sp. BT770]MDO3416714.1 outer membrane beta-barrel protein [Hymenobacter sp. BT770]